MVFAALLLLSSTKNRKKSIGCSPNFSTTVSYVIYVFILANPAVNTPRPSRGTGIESCDFIVLIGDP